MKTERVIYQGREWEKLKSYPNPTIVILSALEGKIPHQILVPVADLGKQPKKPKGETWKLMYNGVIVFEHLNWKLVHNEKVARINLPQYKNGELTIK